MIAFRSRPEGVGSSLPGNKVKRGNVEPSLKICCQVPAAQEK